MNILQRKSPIRLWWRRQLFQLRQLPIKWLVVIFICVVFILISVANPFSRQYSRFEINQNVEWNNIKDLLVTKEEILLNQSLMNDMKFVGMGDSDLQYQSSILIVLYTTIFRDKKFCSFSIERIFGKTCPTINHCEWSCDHTRYREADALIFHAYDIPLNIVSMPKRSDTKTNSVWILWSDEPPNMIDYSPFNSYYFNWTISYKFDSEVSIGAYGLFSKRSVPLSDIEYENWIDDAFVFRQHSSLWFVSNCHSKERLELFHNLKSFSKISVEGYGRCVDYYPLHSCGSYSLCEREYMSKFKFYLSFESNTCQYYITEKFYKPFYYGLIPIVYGPSKRDYSRLSPNNSFIHVDDFNRDMFKLANFIEQIHFNRTLFSMYHQWRKTYEIIVDGKALERIRMCELCYRLANIRKGDTIYYKNIEKFYNYGCNDRQ